jgi:hypothetical protein
MLGGTLSSLSSAADSGVSSEESPLTPSPSPALGRGEPILATVIASEQGHLALALPIDVGFKF